MSFRSLFQGYQTSPQSGRHIRSFKGLQRESVGFEVVGKDGLVVVQGYVYVAPMVLPFVMLADTHGHRFAVTMGYGYGVPSGDCYDFSNDLDIYLCLIRFISHLYDDLYM